MVNEIKTVCIIGAGFLGKLISEKVALKNYTVRIYDKNPEGLDKFARRLDKKKKRLGVTGEVSFHKSLSDAVRDANLIIEAVPEKLDLKKATFSQIDKAAPPNAIIATNSSSIPVSKIEDAVERKDKVLNLHFNHPNNIPMADIMRGTKTSDDTFQKGKDFLESIEITPLVVKKECLGFVFNRVWRAVKKDCLKIWAGDHADIETVDKAWKIFTGMGLGPFRLMDAIGLDVIYDVEMSYYKESGNPDDKPPQALKDMVNRGELGLKTGKGFYQY
ncbi:MAG: 3-hydroxyacyl-CoA dehydrogenase family protein [Candidatus Thorarchaeota archaeon]